ncbi:tetratricopeptide repeat protein, partial [Trichodesmium erythraeum 21-75]|nr:tetratricopeptide repeat protein [Trichodesmium erythraeum 21-75]
MTSNKKTMDEQGLTAYAKLIKELLKCPEGQESNVLQNHQHLIDERLIPVMQKYGQYLAKTGNENKAQCFLNIAQTLAQQLNEEYYMTILEQLAVVKYENYGDSAPIYHILDHNRDLLDENIARVLPQYASDLITKFTAEDTGGFVDLIESLSYDFYSFPRGNRKANIEIAIAGYLFVLSYRQENTEKWAMTQNNLGLAYSERIRGDKAENIEAAIAAYEQALLVYTQTDLPVDWARTQYNLGIAYSKRIREDKAENIETAITLYEGALGVFTQTD